MEDKAEKQSWLGIENGTKSLYGQPGKLLVKKILIKKGISGKLSKTHPWNWWGKPGITIQYSIQYMCLLIDNLENFW